MLEKKSKPPKKGDCFPKRLYAGTSYEGFSPDGGTDRKLVVTVNGIPLSPGSSKHAKHFSTGWSDPGGLQLTAALLENYGLAVKAPGDEAFDRLYAHVRRIQEATWIMTDLDIIALLTEVDLRGLR